MATEKASTELVALVSPSPELLQRQDEALRQYGVANRETVQNLALLAFGRRQKRAKAEIARLVQRASAMRKEQEALLAEAAALLEAVAPSEEFDHRTARLVALFEELPEVDEVTLDPPVDQPPQRHLTAGYTPESRVMCHRKVVARHRNGGQEVAKATNSERVELPARLLEIHDRGNVLQAGIAAAERAALGLRQQFQNTAAAREEYATQMLYETMEQNLSDMPDLQAKLAPILSKADSQTDEDIESLTKDFDALNL